MIDSSISPWPKTGEDLCQLLHISSEPTLRCHGLTRKAKNCTRKISAANIKTIRVLLDTAASSGKLDAAHDLLEKLSGLVLCPKYHQCQGLSLLADWEKAIRATVSDAEEDQKDDLKTKVTAEPIPVKTEPVEVKREPEEPTSEPLLQQIKSAPPKPKPAPPSSKAPSTRSKDKFGPYGSQLTTYTINAEMKKKILKPLSPKELENKNKIEPGCVYVYTFPETYRDPMPYLKIGYAGDLQVRMKAWERKCGYEPKLVVHFVSHLYIRVERLFHAQLRNCRQREKHGCPTCGVKHDEWFLEYTSKVSEVGGLWADWARREPYDEAGNLTQEWVEKLQALDLNDPHCWKSFVNGEA
jgi:hypothetical protein